MYVIHHTVDYFLCKRCCERQNENFEWSLIHKKIGEDGSGVKEECAFFCWHAGLSSLLNLENMTPQGLPLKHIKNDDNSRRRYNKLVLL